MNTNLTIHYDTDEEYQKTICSIFTMEEYDETINISLDMFFFKTKDIPAFQEVYDLAAAKLLSTDRNIGLAILFSYTYLPMFYPCVCDFQNEKDPDFTQLKKILA